MELYISTEGLYDPVKHALSDTSSSLRAAKATAINAPYGFQYSSYVNQLDGVIENYIREVGEISENIRKNENQYEEHLVEQKRKIKYIPEKKLEERIGFRA